MPLLGQEDMRFWLWGYDCGTFRYRVTHPPPVVAAETTFQGSTLGSRPGDLPDPTLAMDPPSYPNVASASSCADRCRATTGCFYSIWRPKSGSGGLDCWLKPATQTNTSGAVGIPVETFSSLTVPPANGTTTDSNGVTYTTSKHVSTGARVGITLGLVVLIGAPIAWCCRRKRLKRRQTGPPSVSETGLVGLRQGNAASSGNSCQILPQSPEVVASAATTPSIGTRPAISYPNPDPTTPTGFVTPSSSSDAPTHAQPPPEGSSTSSPATWYTDPTSPTGFPLSGKAYRNTAAERIDHDVNPVVPPPVYHEHDLEDLEAGDH
ncbi:hypothetical protein HKX48_004333 [Thoreauomyces humboldtii]|nr:hypothetical protein HKX48_004333 [Thoreauomyces humboldtii]